MGVNPTRSVRHRRRHGRAALLRVLRLRPYGRPRPAVRARSTVRDRPVRRSSATRTAAHYVRDGEPGRARDRPRVQRHRASCGTARCLRRLRQVLPERLRRAGPWTPATGLVPLAAYSNEQLRENSFNQTDLTHSRSRPGRSAMNSSWASSSASRRRTTSGTRASSTTTDLPFPRFRRAIRRSRCRSPSGRRQRTADNHGRASIAAVYAQDQVAVLAEVDGRARLALRQLRHELHEQPHRREFPHLGRSRLAARRPHLQAAWRTCPSTRATARPTSRAPGSQLASLNITNAALEPEEFENIRARREVGRQPVARPDRGDLPARPQECRDPGSERSRRVSLLVDGQRTRASSSA